MPQNKIKMATNGKSGDNRRYGAVTKRSQTQTGFGHWVERDVATRNFIDMEYPNINTQWKSNWAVENLLINVIC